MGLMSAGRGVAYSSTNARTLGNGWYMGYESFQPIVPAYKAVVGLEKFYNQVMDSAGDQLANGAKELPDIKFNGNGFSLQLASPDPINWDWIINFVGDMIELLGNEFVGAFKGTASSYLWEVAGVTAALSVI